MLTFTRLCGGSRLFDMAYQLSNLDPSYIMDTITRQATSIITGGNTALISDAMKLMTFDPSKLDGANFWELGQSVGKLFKAITDFNVDN